MKMPKTNIALTPRIVADETVRLTTLGANSDGKSLMGISEADARLLVNSATLIRELCGSSTIAMQIILNVAYNAGYTRGLTDSALDVANVSPEEVVANVDNALNRILG